ncbi:NYN domain-containing protein [Candidatus Saccharibacteria bacterium]|nr:NYN domain-containing protein [Candidatus Saccharibacteria bacterium]
MKRLFVFVDASNLWAVQKAKGRMFDHAKLKEYLKNTHKASEIKIYYYDAYPLPSTRDRDVSGKHKFYVYLQKALDFTVRKKPLKQIHIETERGVAIEEKGNMDVELAIDVVNQAGNFDEAIFFTGDSDFMALVRFIHGRGKKVFIYSSRNNISSELRTGGDGYFDILKITEDIWRGEVRHSKK